MDIANHIPMQLVTADAQFGATRGDASGWTVANTVIPSLAERYAP